MIYQLRVLWLLLSAVSAVEMYDELPDVENEIFQEDMDVRALEPRVEESASRLQDLLLLQLIRAQLRKDLDTKHRSHKGPDEGWESGPVKRAAAERRARPQRWWKIKKGRVGAHMCYFKLCAFRSPA